MMASFGDVTGMRLDEDALILSNLAEFAANALLLERDVC